MYSSTQQIPPSPSNLRKDFLIVGVLVLMLGFFFFYAASRQNWGYVTTHTENVNVGYPTASADYGFGDCYIYPVPFPYIQMQSGDLLTVECPQIAAGQPIYVILFRDEPAPTVVVYYHIGSASCINNNLDTYMIASASLAIPTSQNLTPTTVEATMNLTHYETPQWEFFCIGIVLCTLAMIPIFKSKK